MNTLKHYRRSRGIKQWELAEETGVSQARISCIEKHNDLPSPRHAQRLAAFFGLKVEALFPDGTQMKQCSPTEPDTYEPTPLPRRRYPREFDVMCWHCRSRVRMVADDTSERPDPFLSCPECGARFYDILPLEEAVTL